MTMLTRGVIHLHPSYPSNHRVGSFPEEAMVWAVEKDELRGGGEPWSLYARGGFSSRHYDFDLALSSSDMAYA